MALDWKYRRKAEYDETHVWLPLSVMAVEFNRTPETMFNWARSGFFLEIGFRVKRDVTGKWLVGVPRSEFVKFSNEASQMICSL